jgi:CHAD domain-containing protein
VSGAVDALKKLQEMLGEFQDTAVQIEALQGYARVMERAALPAETLLAIGILIGNLLARQQTLRQQFDASFHDFSVPKNAERFRALWSEKALEHYKTIVPTQA